MRDKQSRERERERGKMILRDMGKKIRARGMITRKKRQCTTTAEAQ
jgi:hypothetical protein